MRSFICIAIALTCWPLAAQAKLRIVTTTTDYAAIAQRIGGDKVEVHSVMKGPESVHNVMAKPTEMVQLNQADLFVHGGLDSEPWRDNLLKGARNSKVMAGKPGNVDMSQNVDLKDTPTGRIDRSMGDVHAYGNPHFQLSPKAVQRMTATLAKAMMQADPANADLYQGNAIALVNEMADLQREIARKFEPYAGLKVVTFHAAWRYLVDVIPIEIAGTIEPKPLITPSPAQVRQIIDQMRAQGVKVVIVETYSDIKLARYVAQQAGAQLVELPDHVRGLPQVQTYPDLFRYIADKLLEAAQAAGIEPKAPQTQKVSHAS